VLCVVRKRCLRRADHSPRGVPPTILCEWGRKASIMKRPWATRSCWLRRVLKNANFTTLYNCTARLKVTPTSSEALEQTVPLLDRPRTQDRVRRGKSERKARCIQGVTPDFHSSSLPRKCQSTNQPTKQTKSYLRDVDLRFRASRRPSICLGIPALPHRWAQ